jgi:SAM-dependent methyltransferase
MDSCHTRDFYLDPFAHFTAHQILIADQVCTPTWQRAIRQNASLFQDRVVLDAGCGLCLLTMFMLQHDPRYCYGIEKSSIITQSREILAVNNFLDRVELIHGDVKDVELSDLVDMMVCDFVSSCGIFDSLFSDFIQIRNRYLKPDGFVFPSFITIWIVGVSLSDYESRMDYWYDVYGFDFQCIGTHANNEAFKASVNKQLIVTKSDMCWRIDSKTIQMEDLNECHPFTLTALTALTSRMVNAFVIWFDMWFVGPEYETSFSTAPEREATIYGQTVCLLQNPISVKQKQDITGVLSIQLNHDNPRNGDLKIDYGISGKLKRFSQKWELKH